MAGQCQAVRRGLRPVLPKLFTLILGVYALSFWKERKERNYGDSWKSTFVSPLRNNPARQRHRMISFKSLRGGCTEDDIVEMAKGAAANINTIDRVEVKRHLVDEDKAEEFLEARKPRNKTYPWDYSKWDEVDVDDDTNDDKDPAAIDDSHTSDPSSNKMRGDLEIPMDADTRPYQGLWEYEDENLKEENETSPYVRVNVTGRVVRFEDGEETVLFRQLSRDTLWVNGYWLSKRETNSTHIVWHRSPYTNIWLRPGIQQTSRPSRILKQSKRVGKFSTNHSKESKSRIEK